MWREMYGCVCREGCIYVYVEIFMDVERCMDVYVERDV